MRTPFCPISSSSSHPSSLLSSSPSLHWTTAAPPINFNQLPPSAQEPQLNHQVSAPIAISPLADSNRKNSSSMLSSSYDNRIPSSSAASLSRSSRSSGRRTAFNPVLNNSSNSSSSSNSNNTHHPHRHHHHHHSSASSAGDTLRTSGSGNATIADLSSANMTSTLPSSPSPSSLPAAAAAATITGGGRGGNSVRFSPLSNSQRNVSSSNSTSSSRHHHHHRQSHSRSTGCDDNIPSYSSNMGVRPHSPTAAISAGSYSQSQSHSQLLSHSYAQSFSHSYSNNTGGQNSSGSGNGGDSGGSRTSPIAVPPADQPAGLSHSQSFVPPHLLASMSRKPESMARSYNKRRPPTWL